MEFFKRLIGGSQDWTTGEIPGTHLLHKIKIPYTGSGKHENIMQTLAYIYHVEI
jgi:hypothetical protein